MPDARERARPTPTPDWSPAVPRGASPEAPFEIPRDLRWLTPRYDFVRELGRGMAVVYLARERGGPEAGREVAVKVIASPHAADRETAERFAREARTATALNHPNIVRTLAIETSGDAVAIVTEYVSGETLRAVLQAHGALPFDRAAAILRDVAAALAAAHAARIVHRDVKPENIFIETGTGRALLGDFGIARPIDADTLLTQDGASLGTPAYMAPEQVDGLPVDERTDVYALGLVGWEMLAGRRPWQGESLYSLLQKQRSEALPDLARLRPDVPLYLHRAISVALAKDPRARWPDASEMLAALTPAPEVLPALAPGTRPVGSDGIEPELASGETIRFKSGQIDALRPATTSQAELAVTPSEYARDAYAVAHLAPRKRRAPWLVGLLAAAALGAGALAAAHRSGPATSGDPQLDSLLDLAARRDSSRPAGATDLGARASNAPRTGGARPAAPLTPSPRTTVPPTTVPPTAAAPTTPATTIVPTAPTGATAAHGSAPRDSANGDVADASPAASGLAVAPSPRAAVHDACRSVANADQRRCLMGLISRNDAALNARYQTLIHALRRQAGGAAEPPAVHALRAEQRAWVDARDAACARQVPLSRSVHWGVARAPCFEGFSQRRAAVLAARTQGKLPQAQ